MEWDHDIDLSKRKITSRFIVERVLARGWKICGFKTNQALFLIYIPGRAAPVKIFSASPPQMSLPAFKIADDKYITNRILDQIEIAVPGELLVDTSLPLNMPEIESFLEVQKKIVVKPLDASHGSGVTVNVTSVEMLQQAILEAGEAGKASKVLLQEQLEGVDVRIVCLDYEYADAISRVPASVVGDGEHSIAELIAITNSSEERGENYSAKLNKISLTKAQQYLGEEVMSHIPESDTTVQVIGVSNVGMGGVRLNVSPQIPEFLKEISIRATKALELPVCGVDFMVRRLPTTSDTFEDLDPKIIEVNACPGLAMYDDLSSPEQLALLDQYLDLLVKS